MKPLVFIPKEDVLHYQDELKSIEATIVELSPSEVSFLANQSVSTLISDYMRLKEENCLLKEEVHKSLMSTNQFQTAHEKLFDDFQVVKTKYENMKLEFQTLLFSPPQLSKILNYHKNCLITDCEEVNQCENEEEMMENGGKMTLKNGEYQIEELIRF